MICGLDISTSITGVTLLDNSGKIVYNEAWDTRKFKDFFAKAEFIRRKITFLTESYDIDEIYIEQSLQSFRSGFSSAKTLSSLSRFNGVVSWLMFQHTKVKPEYLSATSARKSCGIKVPRGSKAKQVVVDFLLDNEPQFMVEYTRFGNVKPECFDKADSIIIAKAGYNCRQDRS
tara:strand:+ start:54776 stop:55297 length:522 start_codon:yes stop_codon:yes gene_type:complete